MAPSAPRVFISYSHDSTKHAEAVLALAQRLRQDGVDAWIDQYENGTPKEGWPRWMLNRLDWAETVLLVCTETYYRRFRGHDDPDQGKGADWEGQLITLDLYDAKSRKVNFVPILFSDLCKEFIPEPLRGVTHYLLDPSDAHSAIRFTPCPGLVGRNSSLWGASVPRGVSRQHRLGASGAWRGNCWLRSGGCRRLHEPEEEQVSKAEAEEEISGKYEDNNEPA